MRKRRMLALVAVPTVVLTVAGAGCGGDDDGDAGSETDSSTATEDVAPPDLVGTYGMTLKPSDVPRTRRRS